MSALNGKTPSQLLRETAPSAAQHWGEFRRELLASGPLDKQTCELIAVAAFAALGYEDSFKFHCRWLLESGASIDVVRHAVLVTLGVGMTAFEVARGLQWLADVAGNEISASDPVAGSL